MATFGEQVMAEGRALAEAGWDDPAPIGHGGRAPIFPAHRLPPWLNDFCVALAEELQVPVDLAAMLALAVLATAAGGRAVAEVRANWREPLNLFIAVAMPPGARKTPVFMRMVRPIEDAEEVAMEAARPDVAEARVRWATAKSLADKAEDDVAKASADAREEAVHYAAQMRQMAEAITVPAIPRLLADDATPETLTSLLYEQGGRLALFSDEGEVFNMMAGRYSASGPNLGVYLKAHVGSPIRVDRKSRDTEIIKRPALTLGLTIQPDMLRAVSAIPGARGRGLLGRILWAVPPSNIGERRSETTPVPPEVEQRYLDEVSVLVVSLREWTDPAVLVFTPEAEAAVLALQQRVERRMAEGGDLAHVADWAAKLVGHAVRIAGLLHLATNVRTSWAEAVQRPVVDDAIAIADYLATHALFAFDAMIQDPLLEDARAVWGWVTEQRQFTRRDFFCRFQYRFRTVDKADPVLDLLRDHGIVRRMAQERTTERGRPKSPKYIVNPKTRNLEV